MIQKITKTHIVCPGCSKPDNTIDHFLEFNNPVSTQWYCDRCGEQYSFTVTKQNDELIVSDLKLTGNKKKKCLILLKHDDIGLVIKGSNFSSGYNLQQEYFYNEHTCPVNYMSEVKEVFDLKNQDIDPHGIFEYIGTLPYDDRIDELNDHEFKSELMKKFTVTS